VTTIVYTDGACSGNPGPGGWAWVVPDGPYEAGYEEPPSTNQRMEIMAAARAVAALTGPLEVRSDSVYVVNCFVKRWWEGWERRSWRNAQGKAVANRDLWGPFIDNVKARCAAGDEIRFAWVKGHAGDEWNETADRLAVSALRERRRLSGRTADELVLGEADPGPLGGHGLVVMGHGPAGLGGAEDDVRRRLIDHLTWRRRDIPDLVVATGLRRGAEQLAAESALEAGVPYVAVLPFPEPDRSWPPEDRGRFAELLAGARQTLVLEADEPAGPRQVTAALRRRDSWLIEHAREAMLIWDGRDPELGRLYRSLVAGLGEGAGDEVWALAPRPAEGISGLGRRPAQ
jgi:ribonuclease HI